MATIESNKLASQVPQTTFLVGPDRGIPLAACAFEVMNRAGLHSLHDTNQAFRTDPGIPISVIATPSINELQIIDVAPNTKGWVVIEQFIDSTPARGWLFQTQAGAAAQFGAKLVIQDEGAVTVSQSESTGYQTVHYVGAGNSQISALTLSCLAI